MELNGHNLSGECPRCNNGSYFVDNGTTMPILIVPQWEHQQLIMDEIMDEIMKRVFDPYDNLIDWAMSRHT